MNFVLLHGAWHGGWCWDGVKQELEARGHQAVCPTMPGHRPEDDRSGITFQHYVDKIAQTLGAQSGPVVLVGHSSAGFMMQAAAPLAADKVAKVIFLNAFILPDNTSQFDIVPPEVSQGMTMAAQASPDNCVPVDEGFIRGVLMDGEPADKVDELIGRLVPQPLALFTTKVPTKAFSDIAAPKAVVFCNKDVSLPPGAYLGMAQGLGKFDLIELDGGHEALFTQPKMVAEGLLKAAG